MPQKYEWLTTTTISNTTTSNPYVWPTDTLIYQLIRFNVSITTRYRKCTGTSYSDAGGDRWLLVSIILFGKLL